MRNNFLFMSMMLLGIMAISFSSCKEDAEAPKPTVTITNATVDDHTVTFTIEATDATSYAWDFGDDEGTSTEQNPVYTYKKGGTYTAKVTVTGEGGSAEATTEVTIEASQEEMLSGNWTADVNSSLTATEIFGDDNQTIPVGMIAQLVPEIIGDQFKFNDDGTYELVDDGNGKVFGSATAAAIYLQTQTPWAPNDDTGGDDRVSTPYDIVKEYGICAFDYTFPENATWEIVNDTTITVLSDDDTPQEQEFTGDVIKFSEGAFLGMLNVPAVAFIRELTPDNLTVELFFNPDDPEHVTYTVKLIFARPE